MSNTQFILLLASAFLITSMSLSRDTKTAAVVGLGLIVVASLEKAGLFT